MKDFLLSARRGGPILTREVVDVAALRQIAKKLQMGLCQNGRYIKINQHQGYSEKAQKMLTKYLLQETREENGRRRTTTHLETFQMADVIKKLAELYGEIGGDSS